MAHPVTRRLPMPSSSLLVAVAAMGLAGCAVPYPVHEQPTTQVSTPVYSSPNPYPHEYRRRNSEPLYEAAVLSAYAVMGQTEQRCWIEQKAVPPPRPVSNVPGAIIGGVIGGILGHQIGGGTGQDLATVGGVLAGAAIGSNVGRDRYGNPVATQDVQRCANEPMSSEPAYWDVTYQFRGVTHRAQMTSPPGATITVNADGEPRN